MAVLGSRLRGMDWRADAVAHLMAAAGLDPCVDTAMFYSGDAR
jgi:hypothetical protein